MSNEEYTDYESNKNAIKNEMLTPKEYEKKIKELANQMGV